MIRVGMFRQFKTPNTLVLAAAVSARMLDMEFFFFNPEDVDFDKQKIKGQFYENGNWIARETDFPDVIDNSPARKENAATYDRLAKAIPFTMRRIGNKDTIYKRLMKEGVYKELLIPTHNLSSLQDAVDCIENYGRVIMKPKGGNRGRGIFYIEKCRNNYSVIANHENFEVELHKISDFLMENILSSKYIGQPYIQCRTRDGLPFDIRIHVRRDMNGDWKTVNIYPRVGTSDGIASNLSQGGYIGKLDKFLKRQFGEHAGTVDKELNKLANDFPTYFQLAYDYDIDALGIDIGIDENRKLWMFEVNSFPGSTFFELESQIVAMGYARHLAKKQNNLG